MRLLLAVVVITSTLSACRSTSSPAAPAVSPDTWATVDGREIKREAVDKAFQRARDASQPPPSEEEAVTAKLSILNDLILEDILLAKAGELKIEVAEAELEKRFTEAKGNMPEDAFQQ